MFGSYTEVFWSAGMLIAFMMNYEFADCSAGGYAGWRYMVGGSIVPSVILLWGVWVIPESPYTLLAAGKRSEALTVMKRCSLSSQSLVEVEDRVNQMETDIGRRTDANSSWGVMLDPRLRPMLLAGVGVNICQQICGVEFVDYYAPTVIASAGVGSVQIGVMATIGLGWVKLINAIVFAIIVDYLGRRPPILWGGFGIVVTMVGMGVSLNCTEKGSVLQAALVIGLLHVFVAFYSISYGPMANVINAEVYPSAIRGRAMSLGTLACRVTAFGVSFRFLTLTEALGLANSLFVFAGLAFLAWLFCFFYIPETKGRSLEEIEAVFEDVEPEGLRTGLI